MLPFFVRELRNNGRLVLAYWFVIALHQIVACLDSFVFLTMGGRGDAVGFHYEGVRVALGENFIFSTGSVLYQNMLGVIYWLLGPSKLIGAQFSILAFAISCITLLKILHILELSRNSVSVLLVFGSLPSMISFGSVTLRESYEVLFFMLAVCFGMKMYMERSAIVNFVCLIISAILMGLFHHGLMVYAVIFLILMTVWTPHPSSGLLRIKKKKLTIMLVMLASLWGLILAEKAELIHLGALTFISEVGLLRVVSQFREVFTTMISLSTARAAYNVALDYSSPFMVVRTFFLVYVNFLFAPFPWQVKNLIDMVGSVESIFRMILIYYSVKHWRNTHGIQRSLLGLMLFLFLSMSFLWSLGTSNYGTAARHNLLSWWILSITGTPMLMRMLSRIRLSSLIVK